MTFKISAKKREKGANLNQMRNENEIPAVCYGSHMNENLVISIPRGEFISIYKQAGESVVLELDVEGEKLDVFIKDIQLDPVTSKLLHVDFLAVVKGEAVTVNVPLNFVGEAPAEKDNVGNVNKLMDEVEVEGNPSEIPAHIDVDLSGVVDLNSSISVKDLKLPEGIKVLEDEDALIITVSEFKKEDDSEGGAEEVDFSQIEAGAEKGDKAEG